MNTTRWFGSILLAVMLAATLAACAPTVGPQVEQPPAPTAPPVTQAPPAGPATTPGPITGEPTLPQPVVTAQQMLANQLGITADQITVSTVQEVQFPDVCLGLPEQGETCAQVVTSGYQGTLRVDNTPYQYRVDLPGQTARFTPLAAIRAQQDLAQTLGIPVNQVQITGSESVEWPNACLGVESPNQFCAELVVPGFRVTLNANGQSYEYHTDQSGGVLFQAPAGGPAATVAPPTVPMTPTVPLTTTTPLTTTGQYNEENLILSWNRIGGIAGFCDSMSVYSDGKALVLDCRGGSAQQVDVAPLSAEQLNQLKSWSNQYRGFTLEQTDQATADILRVTLAFNGTGDQDASQVVKQQILSYATQLFSDLTMTPAAGAAAGPVGTTTPFTSTTPLTTTQSLQFNAENILFSWNRIGGSAGYCDSLTLYSDQKALVLDCRSARVRRVEVVQPTTSQLDQLQTWVNQFQGFTLEQATPGAAHIMTETLAFNGKGSQAASQAEKEQILKFVNQLFRSMTML